MCHTKATYYRETTCAVIPAIIASIFGKLFITHQVTHQVEASPKGGLAQPPKINSQNMTVHDPSVCVASVVFQVHS